MFANRFSSSLIQAILVAAGLSAAGASSGRTSSAMSYGTSARKPKQWITDRNAEILRRRHEAHEWNKKNYFGKVLTRTGRPIL